MTLLLSLVTWGLSRFTVNFHGITGEVISFKNVANDDIESKCMHNNSGFGIARRERISHITLPDLTLELTGKGKEGKARKESECVGERGRSFPGN